MRRSALYRSPPPCGEGSGGGGSRDDALNIFQDAVYIGQYIVIPIAQHAISVGLKACGPPPIHLDILRVLTTISFNNQLQRMRYEIRDVWTDANLTTKMTAVCLQAVPQMPPKLAFGLRRYIPHVARQATLRQLNRTIGNCPDALITVSLSVHSASLRPPPLTPPHKGEGNRPSKHPITPPRRRRSRARRRRRPSPIRAPAGCSSGVR